MRLLQGGTSFIGALLAAISITPIITNSIASANNNSTHDVTETKPANEIGYEYFNICVEISPPFVEHAHQGSDIKLINVIIDRLMQRAAPTSTVRARVRVLTVDILAGINHCDIMFPNVWDNATTASVAAELIGSDFYHVESILLCAAKQRNKDDWRKLRTITTTQMTMGVPFVLYVAITYYIGGKMIHADKFQNLDVMVWSYFRVLSSVPNDEQHQPKQRALRFLYTGWLIFCFIQSVNYNTLILRVFKKELYSPRILNIQQAERQHVDLYTLSAFHRSMMYPRVFDCGSIQECLGLLKLTEQTDRPHSQPTTDNDNDDNNAGHARSLKHKSTNRNQDDLMIALPATVMEYYRGNFMVLGESTIFCFEHANAVYKRQIFVKRQYRGANNNITRLWKMSVLNKLLIHINRSGVYKYWLQKYTRSSLQIQHSFHQASGPGNNGDDETHPNKTQSGNTFTRTIKSFVGNLFRNKPVTPNGHPIGVLMPKDFIVMYAYLLIGVVCSTIGFVGEHVYYYYKHNKRYSFAR